MSTPDDYAAEAATWPELTPEQADKLAVLLRPSNRGLAKIDATDIETVLDGIKAIGEAS